jgi:hypothetical protein
VFGGTARKGCQAMAMSDLIAICNIVATVVAVMASPLIALRISQILTDRADLRKAKMEIFKTLMSQRKLETSKNIFEALNLIDVVYSGDRNVRKKWNAFYEALQEHEMSEVGELRHALLLAMAKSIGMTEISSKDIAREFLPQNLQDAERLYRGRQILELEDVEKERALRAQNSLTSQ